MNKTGGAAKNVFASFVEGFFLPLTEVMKDVTVSEVMINGPSEIFVERSGCIEKTSLTFASHAQLMSALRAVAQYLGRPFDELHPILEGRLPDGSRLQAVMSPIAMVGPCVAIRRHQQESLSFQQLVQWGALTEEARQYLAECARRAENVIVSGGTGSGKTSLLRCVASLIPENLRVITIEDASELQLRGEHIVAFEARPADEKGQGAVSIGDIFRATLRLRPDRIVIGELRGAEALDLIQAMTSGHGGCLSTVHASSALDALRRVETMALYSGIDLPLAALRSQVASAVDVIVQIERCSDGKRWVHSISEVSALDSRGDYRTREIMSRDEQGQLVRREKYDV